MPSRQRIASGGESSAFLSMPPRQRGRLFRTRAPRAGGDACLSLPARQWGNRAQGSSDTYVGIQVQDVGMSTYVAARSLCMCILLAAGASQQLPVAAGHKHLTAATDCSKENDQWCPCPSEFHKTSRASGEQNLRLMLVSIIVICQAIANSVRRLVWSELRFMPMVC